MTKLDTSLGIRISALSDITLNNDDGLPNLVCEVQAESESLENHTWGRKLLKGMRNRLLKIQTFILHAMYYPDKFTILSPNSDVT